MHVHETATRLRDAQEAAQRVELEAGLAHAAGLWTSDSDLDAAFAAFEAQEGRLAEVRAELGRLRGEFAPPAARRPSDVHVELVEVLAASCGMYLRELRLARAAPLA